MGLFGRYTYNSNWQQVNFFRRVEFPGFWIVLLDRLLGFHDQYCQRSLGIVLGMVGIYVLYAVLFRGPTPRPSHYYGPNTNPELKKFLEEETDAVRGVSETPDKLATAKAKWDAVRPFALGWWEERASKDGTKCKQLYPVHNAIMNFKPGDENDAKQFVSLLDKMGQKALDEPLKEWYETPPVALSASTQYNYECTLILLKRGANPYKIDTEARGGAVDYGMKDALQWSGTGKPGALGFSDGFWERFNEICLKKSPPRPLSWREKFLVIVKSF